MNVTDLMRRTIEISQDRLCTIHGDRRVTFGEQWKRGCQLANALIQAGLKPGNRIGVLEDNSIEAADFFLAAAIANLVRVPLYPRNTREAHVHMLQHTGCKAVIVSGLYGGVKLTV